MLNNSGNRFSNGLSRQKEGSRSRKFGKDKYRKFGSHRLLGRWEEKYFGCMWVHGCVWVGVRVGWWVAGHERQPNGSETRAATAGVDGLPNALRLDFGRQVFIWCASAHFLPSFAAGLLFWVHFWRAMFFRRIDKRRRRRRWRSACRRGCVWPKWAYLFIHLDEGGGRKKQKGSKTMKEVNLNANCTELEFWMKQVRNVHPTKKKMAAKTRLSSDERDTI